MNHKNFFLILILCSTLFACKKEDLTEVNDIDKEPVEAAVQTTRSVTLRSNLKLGINGHPLGTIAYTSVPAERQIELLKSMGMSIYRFDVKSIINTGRITVPYLYNPLKRAADAAGIELLPMLYPRTLSFNDNESVAYHKGRTLADRFAREYKGHFKVVNIANELENRIIYPMRAGDDPSHYDLKRFRTIAAYLKGMNDGIKAKAPEMKTLVNANWMHWMYLKMLEEHGVRFDIVGYQWYDEMDRLAARNYRIDDMTQFLSSKFNKPIWFTEINVRNSDNTTKEVAQNDFINSFLEKCRRNPQVEAAIIYQLFDEPEKTFQDAHYGIFKWASPYRDFQPKTFARLASGG